MITLYTGTPGSGKTLHAVSRIWWNLTHGNAVVSNIRLNPDELGDRKDYYRYFEGVSVTPSLLYQLSWDLLGLSPRENGILLVLDECQLIFSNREWRRNSAQGWITFFTQHRKLGYDVILITQYDRMIDRQVRTLVEYESKHRRIDRLPWPWSWIVRVIKGGTFYVRKGWYPLKGEKVGEEIVRVSRRAQRLYDTFDIFQAPVSPPAAANAAPMGGGDRRGAAADGDLFSILRSSPCYAPAKGESVGGGSGGGRGRDDSFVVSDGVRDIPVYDGGGADAFGLDRR